MPFLIESRRACVIAVVALFGVAPARAEAQSRPPNPSMVERVAKTIGADVKSIASVDTFPIGLGAAVGGDLIEAESIAELSPALAPRGFAINGSIR